MSRITFEIDGFLSVNGEIMSGSGQCFVMMEGRFVTSGCTDAAIAHNIGVENIVNAVGRDEILEQFTAEELLEALRSKGVSAKGRRHLSAA